MPHITSYIKWFEKLFLLYLSFSEKNETFPFLKPSSKHYLRENKESLKR